METLSEIIENYRAPIGTKKLVKQMKIALIVGVAAAGKDSILRELAKTNHYARIITTIPRAPRPGEVNGVNHYFIDDEQVKENLEQRKYFEAKLVHGRVYGTTIAELERISRMKKIALGDVDVQGVEEYHAVLGEKLKAIFVIPPDFATWQERWRKRGDIDNKAEFHRRMLSAEAELDFALRANYYRFVVNDDLVRAAKVTDEIIRGKAKSYKDDFARIMAEKLHDDIVAFIGGRPRRFSLRTE